MSLNLTCNQHELWQTPTHITYMCLMQHNGNVEVPANKRDKLRALYCYQEWIRAQSNGVWEDQEAHENLRTQIQDECDAIDRIIKNYTPKLEVSYI